MTSGSAAPTGRRRGAARLRLGNRARKGVLVLHIVAAGSWIGIDVVLAICVFTGLLTDDRHTAALCFQALELFAIWPLFLVGLGCLASGIVLGLGTKYGLVRYWWVAAKLVVNLVFVALVPLSLRHTVSSAAEYGRDLPASGLDADLATNMLFPPIVSPAGLLIAVVLAVFKPWGRIRKAAR